MTGTAYLNGMAVNFSDSHGNSILGSFSDRTHVSGTYHIVYCGYMAISPSDGNWNAILQGSSTNSGKGGITGVWTGTSYNGDVAFNPMITILPGCKEGDVCGWFNLPEFTCAGIFTLESIKEGIYRKTVARKRSGFHFTNWDPIRQ